MEPAWEFPDLLSLTLSPSLREGALRLLAAGGTRRRGRVEA